MSNENVSNDTSISKSAAKRNQRRQEVAAQKKQAKTKKVITITVTSIIIILLAYLIGDSIYFNSIKTKANSDESRGLNEQGFIAGLDVKDYVIAPDYKNIVVPSSEVGFTEEELDKEIDNILTLNMEVDKDTSLTVKDGDRINIDFVGYVDGEPFEGGDSKGNGSAVTIGSKQFVDDFEEQLIGSHPGDKLKVEVTFPTPYYSNESLAGKDATFDVTINGVYFTPEFNDAFVENHFSSVAGSAEEYREYLRNNKLNSDLKTYLSDYLSANAKNSSYPKKYLKILKSQVRANDEYYYEYTNNLYVQMQGAPKFTTFYDYLGMGARKYEKKLSTDAKALMASNMLCQYIFETEGLSVTDEQYKELIETLYGEEIVDYEGARTIVEYNYGKPRIMQMALQDSVLEYLMGNVTVQE